jgi:beta-glucosidase-like glycosyl hydrolase
VETPSEDPFLCGVYGAMHTLGLQNNSQLDDRYLQAVATLKHFDANSLEGPHWTLEGTWDPAKGTISRHSVNAKISLHDLAMSYLPAFQQAVVEGGAAGIMCSYNRINGVPSCANEYLLQQVLRRQWNFRGYVTSDSSALNDIVQNHHYAKDMLEMVPLALQAGCDIESAPWPSGHPHATGGEYITHIPEAVHKELLDEALVDRALRNALEIRFRLGLFDPIKDQPFWKVEPNVVRAEKHVQMAKEATAQGMVLLKNEGHLLPLLNDTPIVALIGPHIHDRKAMAGNYLGELCPGSNFDCITSFAEGFSNATTRYGGTLLPVEGCAVSGTDISGFSKAKDAASQADVVIFMGGLDASLEAEGKDRPDIRLPSVQSKLIQEIAQVNANIVLVLMHGGMVGLDAVIHHVPVVVSMGYPGIYAGEVLPEVLLGRTDNAWGKLAITWYHDDIQEQLNMLDFSMTRPPGRTHRYYTGKPLFSFGHGLNPLTSFQMSRFLQVSRSSKKTKKNEVTLSTNVTNSGTRAATEVVLAFFQPPRDLPASEPASMLRQQLFGFDRVHIEPQSSKQISIDFSPSNLQLYDADGMPKLFTGVYTIMFTTGSESAVLRVSVDEHQNLEFLPESTTGTGDVFVESNSQKSSS